MSRPLQIGVTGGIGSGKSLVCSIFSCFGVPVYDADSRAKKLMTTDGILIGLIQKEFGTLSYHPDGTLNRKYLSEVAFQDETRLERLNSLVHPRVAADYQQWVAQQGSGYVVKEAALLFEAGSHVGLDKVVVVTAPEALRVQRVLRRDAHRTPEMVREIMLKQMPEGEKMKKADYLLTNDESRLLIPQVVELHQRFLSREL